MSKKPKIIDIDGEFEDLETGFFDERMINVRTAAFQKRGKKLPPLTEETKAKMSVAKKGAKLPALTKEHKSRVSATHKNIPKSAEAKAKNSASHTGIPHSEERKAKIAATLKGNIRSKESKAKQSAALKGVPKPKLTCPHCGTEGGNSQMKRWHFDNCKLKRD
jgi:hypothetical protein